MSASLLCASCFEPIGAEDLTQAIVLGAGYRVAGSLIMETAIVHVDCADPRGEFVYDCRRRVFMTERNNPSGGRDRDEEELDEGKGPGEGEASSEAAGGEQQAVRDELEPDRAADREEQLTSSR